MKPLLLLSILAACNSAAPAPVADVQLLVDGRDVPFADPRVLSVDDANEHYQVTMRSSKRVDDGAHTIVLSLGENALPCSSWGGDSGETWLVFPVTAATARAVAAALGIDARERPEWPLSLSGRVEPVGELKAGSERLPLRFVLTNQGSTAVWFLDGGRGRNALGRDNRFEFTVQHDGTPLAIRPVEDFGGLGGYRRLAASESWPFEVDLAHWCHVDRPGTYSLRVSYEAELMPPEFEPGAQLPLGWHAHLQRTRRIVAETKLDVR